MLIDWCCVFGLCFGGVVVCVVCWVGCFYFECCVLVVFMGV